ncbi:hypothetical protein HMPREF9372_0105 [Sporosarcina newyorkensis 2681]|uniref:Uncharacterized protein n=1 Tax=Sporosarcina newyorkensis 2681 TaxID=1027292 RepID=F9DMS5_9BACL|nr:hypothetical protein HMPREF9372_0105 [Sporosarcina newyorkensis 2681]
MEAKSFDSILLFIFKKQKIISTTVYPFPKKFYMTDKEVPSVQ